MKLPSEPAGVRFVQGRTGDYLQTAKRFVVALEVSGSASERLAPYRHAFLRELAKVSCCDVYDSAEVDAKAQTDMTTPLWAAVQRKYAAANAAAAELKAQRYAAVRVAVEATLVSVDIQLFRPELDALICHMRRIEQIATAEQVPGYFAGIVGEVFARDAVGDDDTAPNQATRELLKMAASAVERSDWRVAKGLYGRLLNCGHRASVREANNRLAELSLRVGRPDDAIAYASQSVEHWGGLIAPRLVRAYIQTQRGSLDAALADYEWILRRDPTNQVVCDSAELLRQKLGPRDGVVRMAQFDRQPAQVSAAASLQPVGQPHGQGAESPGRARQQARHMMPTMPEVRGVSIDDEPTLK